MVKRTLKSKNTLVVENATILGYEVTFSYSLEEGQKKPLSVNATGFKPGETSSVNFSASITETSANISFMGGKFDAELEKSLRAEFTIITA